LPRKFRLDLGQELRLAVAQQQFDVVTLVEEPRVSSADRPQPDDQDADALSFHDLSDLIARC